MLISKDFWQMDQIPAHWNWELRSHHYEMGNMTVQARIFIYALLFFLQQGAIEDMYKLFEKQ